MSNAYSSDDRYGARVESIGGSSQSNNDQERKLNQKKKFDKAFVILSIALLAFVSCVAGISAFRNHDILVAQGDEDNVTTTLAIPTDYSVPGLSKEQIAEVSKRSDVSSSLPFFAFNGSLNFGTVTRSSDVYFLDNLDHMDLTSYNKDRLVSSQAATDHSIFIDSYLAGKFSCKLGDEIKIKIGSSSFSYTVSGISRNNLMNGNGLACAAINDEVKAALKTAFIQYGDFQYSQTYVACSDRDSFYSYIKTYLPEAERLPREAFSTDEKYAAYTADFNSTDYSGDIHDMKIVIQKQAAALDSKKAVVSAAVSKNLMIVLIGSAVVLLVAILADLVFAKKVAFATSSAGGYIKTNIGFGVGSLVLSLALYLLSFAVTGLSLGISFSEALSTMMLPFAMDLGAVVVIYALSSVCLKVFINKR
jgi:hypothetical protein